LKRELKGLEIAKMEPICFSRCRRREKAVDNAAGTWPVSSGAFGRRSGRACVPRNAAGRYVDLGAQDNPR
jgi:hypothetical protein